MLRIDRNQATKVGPSPLPPAEGEPPTQTTQDGLHVELDPQDYIQYLSDADSTRQSGEDFIRERIESVGKNFRRHEIRGLLGSIRFTEGYYLVVIRGAQHVADLGCHEIHKADEMELMPVSTKVSGWSLSATPESKY